MDFSFDLHIAKGKDGAGFREVLIIPHSKMLYQPVELDFMGITNGFLQAAVAHQIPKYPDDYAGKELYYNKVLNELISYCYINISEPIVKYAAEIGLIDRPAVFEKPLAFDGIASSIGIPIKEMIMKDHPLDGFLNELEVLYFALGKWLMFSPGIKMSPSERYCSAYQLMSSEKDLPLPASTRTLPAFLSSIGQALKGKEGLDFAEAAILYSVKKSREGTLKQSLTGLGMEKKLIRTWWEDIHEQIKTEEIRSKIVLSRSYISYSGLLPLAWAEILYCVENDLVIRQCLECANFFHVRGNRSGKYCSEVCKQTAKKKLDDKYYTQKKQAREMAQQGKPLEEVIQHVKTNIPGCRPKTIEKWVSEGLCERLHPVASDATMMQRKKQLVPNYISQ